MKLSNVAWANDALWWRRDQIGPYMVSTVEFTLPVTGLFTYETTVFRGEHHMTSELYDERVDAELGHARFCDALRREAAP